MKDEIIRLWSEGKTSNEIAAELHMTRSAVMGHVNRAQRKGLLSRRASSPKPPKEKVIRMPKKPPITSIASLSVKAKEPEPKPVVPPPLPPKANKPKTITELGLSDCRWIRDDGLYCGEKTTSATSSWCPEHHKIVYVPSTKNKLGSTRFRLERFHTRI